MFIVHLKYETVFFDYAKKNHFNLRNELPVIAPKEDSSLDFTNSTIVNFKQDILNNNVHNCATRQKCLRLHNMPKILNPDFQIEWPSYFNMLGMITRPDDKRFVNRILLGLLIDVYKIPKENILLMVNSKHKDLCVGLPDNMLVCDTHEQSYYDWTYHMKNIYGEGLTFSVKTKNKSIVDVGNLIQIKSANKILAYEIAYGTECLYWAMNNKNTVFDSYSIFDEYSHNDKILVKIIDTLFAICAITSENIAVNNKTPHGQILKKLYKNFVFLSEQSNFSDHDLLQLIQKLVKSEFTNSGISETVYQHFLSERNAINTNRYNFLQEKQKLLQKYYDGILNKETVEKRLYNLAEGKYPISPHERQTYLAIPDVLNTRRQR